MGSQLPGKSGKAPSFLIAAAKDPVGANLDRIQVVKGWLDDRGVAREKVFNVMAAGLRNIKDNQVPPVGNTVDVETASVKASGGYPGAGPQFTYLVQPLIGTLRERYTKQGSRPAKG